MQRFRVKICGITNVEDALRAAECGADALGFVLYPPSPRYIPPETARAILRELPPFVTTVGVFVNESAEVVNAVAEYCGLDMAQLHGDESPALCARISRPVMKAFRVKSSASQNGGGNDESVVETMARYLADRRHSPRAFLLDTYVSGEQGGTGQSFDWKLARSAKIGAIPVILAGGLTPENVAVALAESGVDGVDVSSGVEAWKGKKDPRKVKAFIHAVKFS